MKKYNLKRIFRIFCLQILKTTSETASYIGLLNSLNWHLIREEGITHSQRKTSIDIIYNVFLFARTTTGWLLKK